MKKAIIYSPQNTPTQSGNGKDYWVIQFISLDKKYNDCLVGWTGSKDTNRQIYLKFKTLEEAKEYAVKNSIAFDVWANKSKKKKPKSYAKNFV